VRKYSFARKTMGTVSDKKQTEILRYAFHSLKTFSHVFVLLAVFEFSFLPLRVLISSSCNHGNLSFVLGLLKMEKFGKFSSLSSSMLSTTILLSVLTFAHCWLVGFTIHCFFSDFIGWNKLSYFSQIGQFLHSYSNSILKTVQIKSQIGQFWEIKG